MVCRVDLSVLMLVMQPFPWRSVRSSSQEDWDGWFRWALLCMDRAHSSCSQTCALAAQWVCACSVLGRGWVRSFDHLPSAQSPYSQVASTAIASLPLLTGDGSHGSAIPGRQVTAGRNTCESSVRAGAAAPVSQDAFALLVSLLWS